MKKTQAEIAAAIEADKAVIKQLGGPAVLARKLGSSVQRVFNWLDRGIPPAVRLQHMDTFTQAEQEIAAIRPTKRKAA